MLIGGIKASASTLLVWVALYAPVILLRLVFWILLSLEAIPMGLAGSVLGRCHTRALKATAALVIAVYICLDARKEAPQVDAKALDSALAYPRSFACIAL